ncbi:MAG: hypothetical protein A2987_04055 [Omnitrophica bacterium RIFCSPLOWO2_01_FULL_45_10]|nr:MAG: hypothetical protein A2987_04055 [Omnitrophica bacterium RIFCSPLOWO2_01_FULL_45_10]
MKREEANNLTKNLYLSLLNSGIAIYINASGTSMYPFIKNGDRIKIERINDDGAIKIGDIIAINIGEKDGPWFFVHRVVKIVENIKGRVYFTKGDARREGIDNGVAIDSIAGRVTEIRRKNLYINLESRRWEGINRVIAKISLRYSKILCFLSGYISLAIEWRLIFSKVKNRLKDGNPVLNNTEELLLICARQHLDETLKKKAVSLIKVGIDWERFCEITMRNGVTISVYSALNEIAPLTHLPQVVFERLKSAYLYIASKTALRHKELLAILNSFASNKIPVIPLKGTILSERIYGDIGMRGLSADIDLLIKEYDKENARTLFEEAGYSLDPIHEMKSLQWQYHFSKPEAMTVELHWDITMMLRSRERIEGLWNGARLREEDGISYYDFEKEELLLYLSAHFTNSSCLAQLRYVCDINELLRKYENSLDWNSIINKAKRFRLSNSLYSALKMSKEFFNPHISPAALREIKPNFVKRIWIERFMDKKIMFRSGIRRRLIGNFLSYVFFELLEAKGLSEYIAIIKRVLFPPKEVVLNFKKEDSKPVYIYLRYLVRLFKGPYKVLKACLYSP